MSGEFQEIIEILPVSLLDEQRTLVESLKRLAKELGIGLGWHYLLDLSWIISNLTDVGGKRIMDAGAGAGLMQWFLAGQGAEVISVDRLSRADLPLRFRAAYQVKGISAQHLHPATAVFLHNLTNSLGIKAKARAAVRGLGGLLGVIVPKSSTGKVLIYNADLKNLVEISSNSLDAVVSVSSLEHNSPDDLCLVVRELVRVLKPGGALLATLGAARDQDWFHKPSNGWCYTDATLRRIFEIPADAPGNYEHYDSLFEDLRHCAELRESLAGFYFHSGDNGMPWGKWDPQYQPVGVIKVKSA